jgi:hypothetical protein
MALLTFVIPIRHPANAVDWGALMGRLKMTIASISAQTCADWSCVIVANRGANLPSLPGGFTVEWVDFPPNPVHEKHDGVTQHEFFEAVRLDKGRRVLAGMMRARDSRYLMVVDDDDLISRRLVAHVRENEGANGWLVYHGFMWGEGSRMLMRMPNFNKLCGTSLVIRTDLYRLPDSLAAADDEHIKSMFGSHYKTHETLDRAGAPLAPLPFDGAIYRVGQAGSHSKLPSVLSGWVFSLEAMLQPKLFFWRLKHLRWMTTGLRREFFGQA